MYTLEEVKKNIAENVTGKIVAHHTIDKHRYKLPNGQLVDSVTQRNIIDKPHLIPWAVRLAIEFLEQDDRFLQLKGPTRDDLVKMAQFIHRDNRDDAGTVGGKAHDCLEIWIKEWIETGVKPGDIREFLKAKGHEDSRVWGSARAGEAVFKKNDTAIPVACEILVGWDKEGAGTLDVLVWIPSGKKNESGDEVGHLELWDWKTSNQMDDFYAMQVSAYRRFFMKMTGLKIEFVKIFKLDKESDRFHVYNVPFPNRAYAAFRRLSWVYDWRESDMKKLLEDKNRIII
jgi:hypothetical protein